MKILRLLLTIIFCYAFSHMEKSLQAMDAASQVPAQVSISSEPLLAETAETSISLAQALYPQYKSDFDQLGCQLFLPTDPEGNQSQKLYLLQLCHLAQIKNGNNKQPLDQKTIEIIARSRSIDTTNSWCLALAPWVLCSLSCCSLLALGALCPVPTAAKTAFIISGSTVGCTSAGASGVYGWYTTGYLPDKASNRANIKQNGLANLYLVYPELARELIDLYTAADKQKFAQRLAQEIDIPLIRQRANLDFHEEVPHPVFNELESAISYIKTGKMPSEHDLKFYIKSQTVPTPPLQSHFPLLH